MKLLGRSLVYWILIVSAGLAPCLLLRAEQANTLSTTISGPRSEVLKMTRSKDGRLCVKVQLGQTEYNFYVDTGADTTIHSEIASKYKIQASDSGLRSAEPTGPGKPILVGAANLRIGHFRIFNIPVTVSDLSALRKMNAEQGLPPLDGIIGANLLELLRAKINFGDSTLTLQRPVAVSR